MKAQPQIAILRTGAGFAGEAGYRESLSTVHDDFHRQHGTVPTGIDSPAASSIRDVLQLAASMIP